MADEHKGSRKWSLEEIDELLQDSGMLPRDYSPEDIEEVAPAPKESPFNPRPSRNEKIKHRIISEKVEKSDGNAEPQVYGNFGSEKYREKFSLKPSQNITKTKELSADIKDLDQAEQGGFKKNNIISRTDEFPVTQKTIIRDNLSVDIGDKTITFDDEKHKKTIALRALAVTDGDAHDVELPAEEDDAQLTFEGFHTADKAEQVDEAQVEAELIEKRKAKVSTFAITSEIQDDAEAEETKLYGTDEYRTVDDKFKVKYYLKKKKTTTLVGMWAAFVLAILSALISLFAVVAPEHSVILIIVNILITVGASAINFTSVLDGIKSFKGLKFNKNTGNTVVLAGSIIQSIVLLFCENPFETGVSLFSGAAIFALALNMSGEYLEYKRIINNFDYITSGKDLFSVNYIENKTTAKEIGKGLLIDEPLILSSQKTLFPRRFIELSRKLYPSDNISKKLVPLGFFASLFVGALTILVTKDIRSAVTAFCGALCVSLPYFSVLADCIAITRVSNGLLSKGAMLSGWQAHTLCEKSNAIVIDSPDAFDKNGGDVFGIHSFYGISADEAIIYAATLTITSGGPVGNLFSRVIIGQYPLLPPVEDLTYEDKLGLSAWIFNRRVLVGNEALLRNHNVEIPDKELIDKHLKEGRYPLYLAIDGKAAAVFIISYDTDAQNARLIKKIEEHSISILLKSDDANITDAMVSEKFSLAQSGVKVLSAISGDAYKAYLKEVNTASDAFLIHNGKARSFLAAVEGALSLSDYKQIIKILQVCACGIGISVVAVLSFVSGLHSLSCFGLILLQIGFSLVSSLIIAGGHALKNTNKSGKRKK